MWNRFSGKSDDSDHDLPSQSDWRNNGEQRHPANRSNPIASATLNKKSFSSADYRDPQGFNPTFRSHSSTTRGQHPGITLASIASSYATASGDNNGQSHMPPGLARDVSLADQMPRSSSSRDHEQTRETRDKRRCKTERSHGPDQSAERRQKRDKRSKKDKASRRPEEELDKELGTSRGPDDFPEQVASSGFSQFPGQYGGAMPGSNDTAHEHLVMSSHVQDQFPGQFPIQSSAFYHPPLAASEGGPGLAAEYYGDAGQSVAEQPGNRVNTPSLIIGAEPHLQPALAVAAPPPEPSASGAVGAAASFFSGEFEEDEAASTHGQQDSSTSVTGQIRPNSNYHSSSAPVISTIGGTSIGSAAGYLIDSQTSSHHQRPDHESSIDGAPSEYFSIATHQPPSEMQNSYYSSTSQPSKPGKQSSQLSSNPMYAAGVAGTAGLAAAAYEHNHHSSNQNFSSTSQHSTSSMAQRHRNRGPLSALLDFFKDPEGVAQFEEYSQIIGVCRHCFAPGSSSRDAPRKHFYGRRRSNERYGSTTRVDKDSRYYSSENESRRKNKSWLGPGLAGYGLAKVGESLFMEKDDFDDTYSAKTGRFPPDGKDRRARRRSRSKEHFEIGITGDNKSDRKGTRDDMSNGTGTTTFSTRRYSRMRSRSKDRETGLTEPAIGAALGTPVVASSSRRQSRSPRGASVKSKHMSQAPSPERRHKTKKKKRDGGFFSFGNGSSSSSSVDLAYSGSQIKHRSSKGSTGKSKDDQKAEAALLGLGAAAAALALNDGRQGHRKKGGKQHVSVKETKDRDGRGLAPIYRPKKSSGSADDELWESAAEDEYESMDSDLAYGGPVRRDSRASLSSESPGTNRWLWRWGSKKNRRASPSRRKSSDHTSFPAVASEAGADATGAALASPDHRHGSVMNSTSSLPLQHVYPVPTSDPSRFDVGPEAPIASSNRPAMSSRPEAVPLQHPQPIAPVSAAIYSNQMAYDHSYSAPTGVAVFSQTPYHRHPGTSDARHSTHEASIRGSDPRFEQQADDKVRGFTIRRSDTSPAKYGADSILSPMAPRRRSSAKDDSSAVRFDLTEQQEKRDRSERRLKRKQDKERREAREQEQIEKDRRAPKEESVQQRTPKTKAEKGPERSRNSWVGPAAAGLVGPAIGSAAARERSRSEEIREERRERRRREREIEDEKDALNKSERRRRQRERDDQEATIKDRGRLPDEISASSEYVGYQGHSGKKHDMSVWQEAASTKRSSSHEDYGAFFTPLEFLNKSSDQVKTTSANADADIDLDQVPQIVTVEPKRIHDLSDSPAFSFADIDNKVDPSRPSFPWQVPRLRLVEPTPPSTTGSTPILQPKDAGDEGFEEPRKDVSPSKVKWADDQNREYTIIAPKEDCDESIEPPSGETSGTDPVDLSRSTHERGLPDDKTPPHRDLTMGSSSASYGEDVEFVATLAASAEDAGFDPSIVINNPTYRRRDSPPGSNERSMPGVFDDENEPRLTKKERKRKEKMSRHQSLTDGPTGRNDDRIVQDIISQVEESESQPSDQVPLEHRDDVWESTKEIEHTQSQKGWKGSGSGDKLFETSELASEAFKSENCDVYESPTEEVRSIASIRNEAESGEKTREEVERDSTDFDDPASIDVSPSTTELSKDPEPKAKDKRKGSFWDRVLGKSTDSLPQKDLAKVITEQSIAEGYDEPEEESRMSKVRKSSRAWDHDHDSKERNSVGGTTPQVLDMFSQDLPVKGQETSLPSTFSDAGSVPKHLDHGVELEQIEEKQPETFLDMRPEPPPPPDTRSGSEGLSIPLETASLPTSPRAESETKRRRFSDAEISNPTHSTTALPSSSTAVPFHSRRRGRSSSTVRSLSQTPLSSNQSAADIVQKQKTRSRSMGFESSKEIRPLLLVERHMSHQTPTHDEIYPSLLASHTTSTSSSVHDPEERKHHQKGSYELKDGEHGPIEVEPAPLNFTDSHSIQPDPFDSQQATPTASPFQESTTVVDSRQACRGSSPKVAVEENPQHSSSTLKSGTLGAIVGGSAAAALSHSTEQNDPIRQDLPREEDEDFERALDDIVLDTVTYPSYDDKFDQEADFFPPRAKKGKKNKRKAGQSRQGAVQPSLAGATEAKPSTETVDPELLSPEAMRQIQEQDAQDAVDSWFPSVRSSTKGKKGKKGKGKALVARLPEESGPALSSYEPSGNNLGTTVPAEGQGSDSLIREMSREQVVDIMTAAAQDAKKVEKDASQSATVLLEEPVEIKAEENRIEPKGERDNKDVKELPQKDLQEDDLPQEILQETTHSSDGISQDGLQTNALSPHNTPRENPARDDFPQDNLRHRETPQLEIQQKIHPQDDSAQVNPPRDDFSQSQELQALSLQGDPQPDSLPVLSLSSAPAATNFVDPYIDKGHASLLESPKAQPASQDSFRGDLITAISPQLELSPRAMPLPHGDDEHDLLDERLGTPTFTSSDRHDDEEKGTAVESHLDVSQIQDQSATTPGPQRQSQDIPSQADTVDAGRHLAAPSKSKSKKGKKAKQSFSVEGNETAENQADNGLSPNVITSPSLEQDWLKGLNKEPGIEVPEDKFEMVEDEYLGFDKSKKDKIEKATKQSSSVENSEATEMHEGQALLPHIAASGVLEDHEAMKLIDESAVDVAQPKTEFPEDEWTGLNDNEKSKEGEKVKPLLSRPNTKTTETEEESGPLSRPAPSQELEYREARDLIGEPAMHVPKSKLVEEVPIDLIDELASQAPEPKMREDDWARSDSKAGKQAEKQGSKTIDLEPGAEEREHQSEQQLDATDEVDNRPSSFATTRTLQEINARPGLSETEAAVGDEAKEAYTRESQAVYSFQRPSGGQIFGRDERNLPVLFEPEAPQFECASGKVHDDERFPTQDMSVASTDAAQVVQDLLAGGNKADSVTDAKSEAMTVPTGMKEATVDTPTKEDEIEWDAPKTRKKGKKGKKNEASSWNEPETIQPAEVSGPPSTMDTSLEQEPAAGRPIEEDELDRNAPKRKKGKKGKKSEAFSSDEPKVMEPGESSGPSAAMKTTSSKQEPAAKANDEVFSKQSKKDKKGKKGRRKGASRAISDFRDEDEPNVVPPEDPQDEDKVEDLSAIASGVQGDIKPSFILTQHPQDDNRFEEQLHTITQDSRNEVEPNVIPSELLHNDDQVEDRSAVDHPSVTGDVREVVEPDLVLTEAPPDQDSVEDLPVDAMPPIGAEIGAPRELLKSAVPTDLAQNDGSENSQDAPLEQEEHFVPPKGKKEKKKSKKSKKSTAFSLNDDENLTLGDGQTAGTKALAKDEPERRIPSSVDVIEQSEKTVPKIRLGQEEDFTLPTKTKDKKKSKKFNAFALDKEGLPTLDKLEDEPTSKTKDLEEEVSKKTCPPSVGKEPGTNVKGLPEEKKDRDQIEEAQPAKWKSEDVTARSEPEPAQDPNKDPETDSIVNTMHVSGDLGMVEGKREQSMRGDSDSISAHAATPEISYATTSSVASSLEQPAGASEETLANHANGSKGNIVPAVDTDMDPPFSLKPSKKTKETGKKARSLTWEEDEVSQEPGIIFNKSSATDDAGEPSIIPIPQHSEPWSKPEICAQEVDSTEVVRSGIRSKEDQGHQGNVWEETSSQARHDVENPVPKLEEDRSPADVKQAAGVTATSPLQGNEQTSEQQARNDMNTAAAIRSNHENPTVGLEKEQVPILAEPGAIDEATDEGLPRHVPVQMAEKPASKQDEVQRDEPKIKDSSSSVAPGPAQEIVETVGKQEHVADLELLGSLGKARPIPTVEVEMLDAQEQREYHEKYARELERAVPSAGPFADFEPLGSLDNDKRLPAMEDEMLDAQDQRDYNEEDAKEHERTVPNAEPVADLEPLGGPDIDVTKPIPALEVEMLDAQEQRDYNEEYAKELERQLSPLQEGERADFLRDEANTPILSHSSIHSVIEGPYQEDHRPLARPPALEDIIEESRSRPGSVQGSIVDREDEFSPIKSTKKGKKGKKGKKKQPVIWEDETATPPLKPGSGQGTKPSITPAEGPGSWTTDTARPLDLEEPVYQQSSEDRTIASPTGDLNTAYKKSADIVNDRSDDYFATERSRPAEEDVGMEETQNFRRALATEPPYTSKDQFPAQETQADREGCTRDDAFETYSQDEGLAPLAADFRVKSSTNLEPAVENIEDDFDPTPIKDARKGTKPEKKALAREPNLQDLGHEDVVDKPRDLQNPTVDTLNEGSPSPQYSLQPPLHEDKLSSITEGKSTSRGKSGNIEGVAAAVGLGVGALAGESFTRKDSEKERKNGKKAKEVGSWTDFEAGTGEPENTSSSLDREELATREQERCRTPESERASQHHQATPSRSPPSANHKAVADHSTVGNLGQSSEMPEYRDSAIYVCDSPIIPEEIPHHRAVRDSGFPETEASPTFDDKVEDLDAPTELERGIAGGENVEHVQHQHSRARETERQGSTSRNPLEISLEANSDYDVSISRPREGRKHSRRRSGVAYDSDDSADSGFDVQRRRRRQAMAAEPRVPSPVSSTTKDRSSVFFDSSPSVREEIAAKPQDRDLSPLYDPVGGKPTGSFNREGSPQEVSKEGRSDHVPEDAPESTGYNISGDHHEATGTSLFGGPRNHEDDLRSPSRSPRSSESRGRRRLNTISEDSADESALHKKDKRALSDVGSPESGANGRRTRSPAVGGDVPSGYVSTHDPISRHLWPAAEKEKGAIDERSRSRNSDQLSTLSSRHSGRAGLSSSGHGDEEHRPASAGSMGSEKSYSIHAIIRTPDPVRSASGMSYRSTGTGTGTGTSTPPLRRVDRSASGDLRGASKKYEAKSHAKKTSEFDADLDNHLNAIPSSSTYDPVTDKGKSRAEMTDVYEGWGDVRGQSPISPTRPASMRKRQSMHLLDLETRLDQLVSENRLLASQKLTAEKALQEQARDHSQERHAYQDAMQEHQTYLTRKDSELSELKRIIEQLHDQAAHLTEVNEGLASSRGLDEEHQQRYNQLQAEHAHTHEQWQQSRRELEDLKEQHTQLSTGMEDIVRHEVTVALEEKNIELHQLQSELEHAKQQVRNLQQQLLASRSSDDFVERDEDYFDSRCQSLCQHVQQWVLRFSKFSDMKACYLAREIRDEKVVDRMENAILDGSDVDDYLSDRVKRRDVFMSVVMTMIWEFIFTRYLFGMDREQRQKLKSLEKTLQEVGPISAVHKWRATTLTLLMKREAFENQRTIDTEAVVHEIYDTLATFLPPPSHLVGQIQDSLRKVIDAAVDLSIEMRTQRAEYSMLPPLQPEYDTNGDLARKVYFSALTMNERSGATSSNEALQEQQAVVRMVLFPLVVKNEDDDEQIVVCPAQVLTAEGSKGKKTVRVLSAQGGRSEASFAGSDVRIEGGMI